MLILIFVFYKYLIGKVKLNDINLILVNSPFFVQIEFGGLEIVRGIT